MVTNNDWGLRPADLPWSSPISEQAATSVSTPDWDSIIWFDVVSSLKREEKEAKRNVSADVRNLLKKRADARTKLLEAKSPNSIKNNNISALVDWSVQVLNDMGVSAADLQKYVATPEWWMEMIDNLKSLSNWKYSWEIENFINWNSPYDATWMLNQLFPQYMQKYWYDQQTTSPVKQALDAWKLTAWEKFKWWTNTNEAARTTKRILWWISNLVLWAANELVELWLWWADLIDNITNKVALQSPESYLKQLTSNQWQERYNELVNAWEYKWSFEKWVTDAYDKYSEIYDNTMGEPWLKDKYENWRDTNKLDWYDEDAPMTQVWEWGTKVSEWFAADKWMKRFLNWIRWAYKWYKWLKAAEALKWAASVWEADVVAAWAADDIFKALWSKTERELAWNMFDKISEAFAKSLWNTKPNALSRFLEWSRIWTEMQALDDIHEWELSKPMSYALSAVFNWVFNTTLWAVWDLIWKAITPSELIQRSASRLDQQTIDKYTSMAKKAAVEPRSEHPLTYITKKAANGAKWKVDSALKSEWAKLWQIRANLPESDLSMKDALNEINKWFSENNMWIRIVWDVENWFQIEGVPSSSEFAIDKIVKKLNSMLSEIKFKASEWAEIPNSTKSFEEFYTALKRIWRTADKTDKPMFEAIEDWLRQYLDKALWWKYAKLYSDALAKNAELYWIQWAIEELPKFLSQVDKAEWWWQAVMSNWMTLTELLDYLEKNKFASNLIDEREIAWYLQSYYKVPITNQDRVMYPSPSWALQELQKITLKAFKNPMWNKWLRYATPTSEHIWRPLSSYGKWYEPSKFEKWYWTVWNAINKSLWWEAAVFLSEDIEED